MTKRTVLVVSAQFDAAREAVAAGRWPRKDITELARTLDADVIDYATVESHPLWRLLRRVVGAPVTQAVITYTRRGRYDQIYTDGEHIGIPLAVLLRLSRWRPRHVTIGHLLTTPLKRRLFRLFRPQQRIDAIMLHAAIQRDAAVNALGFRPEQTVMVPWQADERFWSVADRAQSPAGARPAEPARDGATTDNCLISTAGLEYRDYPTLLRAVRDLPVRVVIAAASHWSTHGNTAAGDIPPNVSVTSLDYPALRDLYARSNFVVVPLRDADNQAGITTMLEAMALGKALIVTASRGQRDVIRGRLCTASGMTDELINGPAPFGITGETAEAETGLYVPPADPAALRRAIQYLLDHPHEAARMGAAGQRLVREQMSLDRFVERVATVITSGAVPGDRRASPGTRSTSGMRTVDA